VPWSLARTNFWRASADGCPTEGTTGRPFDYGIRYLAWAGGSFSAALGLAYVLPERRWLWGLAILSGFFSAMVLEIIADSYTGRVSHNLWPLTLAFTVLIGAPPAFAGAYFGAKRRLRQQLSDRASSRHVRH
jgi:hypothetical protein